MPAGNQDINIEQNASFIFPLFIAQADGVTPYDLSVFNKAYAQIRPTYGATLAVEITCTITSAQDGLMSLTLTPTQTLTLTDTLYRWDLYITDGTNIIRLLQGIVNVIPAVTDETVVTP